MELSDSISTIIILIAAVTASLVVIYFYFNVFAYNSTAYSLVTAFPNVSVISQNNGNYVITITLKNSGVQTSIVSLKVNDKIATIVDYKPSLNVPTGITTYNITVKDVNFIKNSVNTIVITLSSGQTVLISFNYV
jgi:hypothetical protein